MVKEANKQKASVGWMALSPDGRQAWACDHVNQSLQRFDVAAEPPAYAGRVASAAGTKDEQGLMYGVDGRKLVSGAGAVLNPPDGKVTSQLTDEAGKAAKASNSMLALEVDAASGRILRANQQCAPNWPATSAATPARTP